MKTQVDAIYEDGVLKPLTMLDLPEHAKVHVIVSSESAEQVRLLPSWPRSVPAELELADPTIDRDEVLAAMAKIPGSIVEELRRERQGRL
jgi:predicted DNA-binding antitoxin AbrB/MazE fold protein